MSHFQFPALVEVQLCVPDGRGDLRPARIANVAVSVRTFARAKNDYDLGPFFSDLDGRIEMTETSLRALAAGELQSGLMDYVDIESGSFALVEISAWSIGRVNRAAKAREVWGVLPPERALWRTKQELLGALKSASNAEYQLDDEGTWSRIRDEWDQAGVHREYQLCLFPRAR